MGFWSITRPRATQIELAGMEKVEDRDTYKLKLTMKSGQLIHVWIDAQTYLEAKVEGQPGCSTAGTIQWKSTIGIIGQ